MIGFSEKGGVGARIKLMPPVHPFEHHSTGATMPERHR